MNKTQIANLEKLFRRLTLEKRAYSSAGQSHLYVASLFPKKSVERAQLETAAQDAYAWAAEIAIQIAEVRNQLEGAKIPLN